MTDTSSQPSVQQQGATAPPRVERVVVGVDGSPGSLAALRWALREARAHGVKLHAVFAWQFHRSWGELGLGTMFPLNMGAGSEISRNFPPTGAEVQRVEAGEPLPPEAEDGGHRDAQAAADNLVDRAVAHAFESEAGGPEVPITHAAIEGHAAKVLLETVTPNDVLVVGSRGHGEFTGALLGSIGHHVVSHAICPVVVVPDPERVASGAR